MSGTDKQVEPLRLNLCGGGTRKPEPPSNSSTPDPDRREEMLVTELPPLEDIPVLFGWNDKTGEAILWHPNDTEQVYHPNSGIIGTMGTGKTQFLKSVVAQMIRDQRRARAPGELPFGMLIFDYKGDYNTTKADFVTYTKAKVFKPFRIPVNPLALIKGMEYRPLLPVHTANTFKKTITKAFHLGPKQEQSLLDCIIRAYQRYGIEPENPATWDRTPPTFTTVYDIYMDDDSIKKNDSLFSAMSKLNQFMLFEPDPLKTSSLYGMLDGVMVIDLTGYEEDIQNLIVAIMLDIFYAQMQAQGSSRTDGKLRQLTKMILVDEADNFIREDFKSLKRIMKEGREFGVGTLLSTQSMDHFFNGEDDYSRYVLSWVVHNVGDLKARDVEYIFKLPNRSARASRILNEIKNLARHHSLARLGNQDVVAMEDQAFWRIVTEQEKGEPSE